jgi:hypothetical protein
VFTNLSAFRKSIRGRKKGFGETGLHRSLILGSIDGITTLTAPVAAHKTRWAFIKLNWEHLSSPWCRIGNAEVSLCSGSNRMRPFLPRSRNDRVGTDSGWVETVRRNGGA